MEIGVFSSCVAGEGFDDRLAAVKDLGYDFLELSTSEELIDGLAEGSVDELRESSRARRVPVRSANLGTFPPFAESCGDAEARKKSMHRLDVVCDLLAEWGPGHVLLLPVWEPEGGDAVDAVYVENLPEVAERAGARSVKVALEHIGASKFRPKASEMLELVRMVGHRNLGFYFDIGNCQSAGEDPMIVLESAVGDLTQFHLKGTHDVAFADMPLADMASLLGAAGYTGRAAVEIPAHHGDNSHLVDAMKLIKEAGFA